MKTKNLFRAYCLVVLAVAASARPAHADCTPELQNTLVTLRAAEAKALADSADARVKFKHAVREYRKARVQVHLVNALAMGLDVGCNSVLGAFTGLSVSEVVGLPATLGAWAVTGNPVAAGSVNAAFGAAGAAVGAASAAVGTVLHDRREVREILSRDDSAFASGQFEGVIRQLADTAGAAAGLTRDEDLEPALAKFLMLDTATRGLLDSNLQAAERDLIARRGFSNPTQELADLVEYKKYVFLLETRVSLLFNEALLNHQLATQLADHCQMTR